jgi:hypothetical protein
MQTTVDSPQVTPAIAPESVPVEAPVFALSPTPEPTPTPEPPPPPPAVETVAFRLVAAIKRAEEELEEYLLAAQLISL